MFGVKSLPSKQWTRLRKNQWEILELQEERLSCKLKDFILGEILLNTIKGALGKISQNESGLNV